ncbi:hypothetical protein ABZ436_00575 [Micromonospora matsumotoense]
MNTAATDLPVLATDEEDEAPRASEHTPYPCLQSDRAQVTPEGGEQS